MEKFKDLPPRKDPKGGSPKTPPSGIPVRDFQYQPDYPQVYVHNDHSLLWRTIAGTLGGMVAGLFLAWLTAIQNKGVTQEKLEDYVTKHSPYLMDKQSIDEHNRTQDENIGILTGKQDRAFERIGTLERNQTNDERELSEFKGDMKNRLQDIANLLDEQRKARK